MHSAIAPIRRIGAWVRDAALRHIDRDGSGHGLGLGRIAPPLRAQDFSRGVAPAIDYAENGFPISQRIAMTGGCQTPCRCRSVVRTDPDSVKTGTSTANVRLPTKSIASRSRQKFRLMAEGGRDAFYKGEIARAIVKKSDALGGSMTLDDLAITKLSLSKPRPATIVAMISTNCRPRRRPGRQTRMLNILEACVPKWAPGQTLAGLGPRDPKYWHMWSKPRSSPTGICTNSTPIRIS